MEPGFVVKAEPVAHHSNPTSSQLHESVFLGSDRLQKHELILLIFSLSRTNDQVDT